MFSSTISAIIGNFLTLLAILDIPILPFLATLGIKLYIIIHTGSIQMISKVMIRHYASMQIYNSNVIASSIELMFISFWFCNVSLQFFDCQGCAS